MGKNYHGKKEVKSKVGNGIEWGGEGQKLTEEEGSREPGGKYQPPDMRGRGNYFDNYKGNNFRK